MNSIKPFMILTYSDIFNDDADIKALCQSLPIVSSIRYVAQEMSSVVLCVNDVEQQNKAIDKLQITLNQEQVEKLLQIKKEHELLLLISESSFIFYKYLLLYGDRSEKERELTNDEICSIYKIILLCNNVISEAQTSNIDVENIELTPEELCDLNIRIDIPVVEFKRLKNFQSQIYKATRFFLFLEQNQEFGQYLPAFYEKYHVSHWSEYIERLFNFIVSLVCRSDDAWLITADEPTISRFMQNYCINLNNREEIDTELNKEYDWLNYIRDHFVIKRSDNTYVLLNLNLLIDKIYQGLFFDYKAILVQNNLGSSKSIHDKKGQLFSEPYLLYHTLYNIFSTGYDKILSENRLVALGLPKDSLPDFYIRRGNSAIIFECKDITLGNQYKYSTNTSEIKNSVAKRLCTQKVKENGETSQREGVAQLLHSAHRIYNEKLLKNIDEHYDDAQNIFLVLITTDRTFSANGINAFITNEFVKISKECNKVINKLVVKPIIVELDTILDCLYLFKSKKVDFFSLITDYVLHCNPLVPFSAYIIDKYVNTETYNVNGNSTLLTAEFASRLATFKESQQVLKYCTKIQVEKGTQYYFIVHKNENGSDASNNVSNLVHSWPQTIVLSANCYLVLGDESFLLSIIAENKNEEGLFIKSLTANDTTIKLNEILNETLSQAVDGKYSFDELQWYYSQDDYSKLKLFNILSQVLGCSTHDIPNDPILKNGTI